MCERQIARVAWLYTYFVVMNSLRELTYSVLLERHYLSMRMELTTQALLNSPPQTVTLGITPQHNSVCAHMHMHVHLRVCVCMCVYARWGWR